METSADFTQRVLTLFADMDSRDMLFWRVDDNQLSFYAICNDVFCWGCADLEQITPENIAAFEQTHKDVEALSPQRDYLAVDLFVARQRGMRPQGAVYAHYPPELIPLFDACGPPREVGFANPRQHPAED